MAVIASVRCGLLLLAVAITCQGCALVDQRLDLEYPNPAASVDPAKPRVRVVVPPTIEGAKFSKKGEPIIAHVKNGYGMTTAMVYPKGSLPEWIARAVASELQAKGYGCEVAAEPAGVGLEVRPRIARAWIDTDVDFWSIGANTNLDLDFDLIRDGRRIESIHVEGRSEERSALGNARLREESLRDGLISALKDAVPRIVTALESESTRMGDAP